MYADAKGHFEVQTPFSANTGSILAKKKILTKEPLQQLDSFLPLDE